MLHRGVGQVGLRLQVRQVDPQLGLAAGRVHPIVRPRRQHLRAAAQAQEPSGSSLPCNEDGSRIASLSVRCWGQGRQVLTLGKETCVGMQLLRHLGLHIPPQDPP